MTALPVGIRPRGLTWSVLTTHRFAVATYLACLTVAAAVLVALRFLGTDVRSARETCVLERGSSASCLTEVAQREDLYRHLMAFVQAGLAYLPLVVAAFAGAALIGRELERGTAVLAWTQSVTPVRWLTAKLTLPAAALVLGTAGLTLLFRWASVPGLSPLWYDHAFYVATGPASTAYALLGLVAGAVAGLLVRRTLPALASGVAATGAAMALGALYRDDLWPTVFRTSAGTPWHAQVLETGLLTASGERLSADVCVQTVRPDSGSVSCLQQYDAEVYTVFHPASHHWPIQLVETGLVLGLTAVLTATAFRLLRGRLP